MGPPRFELESMTPKATSITKLTHGPINIWLVLLMECPIGYNFYAEREHADKALVNPIKPLAQWKWASVILARVFRMWCPFH